MRQRKGCRAAALMLLISLLLLPSCSRREAAHSRSFVLMDTVVTVTLYTDSESLAEECLTLARTHLEELDRLWSRHIEGSDIAKLNASENGLSQGLDSRTLVLLKQAQEISAATGGCFDFTLAPLSDLWQECANTNRLPTSEELSRRLTLTGAMRCLITSSAVEKPTGMQIDLGGIGKGAAVSSLISLLSEKPLTGGLISFGSNVAMFGAKPDGSPFRAALRDPLHTDSTVGTLTLPAGSVLSVSGDYERFVTIQGSNYHHILDPQTGCPSQSGLSSVAVICSNGALADALSTALLVMGRDAAMELYASGAYSFEAILISSSGECTVTSPSANFTPN